MKKTSNRQVIIAVDEEGFTIAFTTLTNCCAYLGLPYHSLKNKGFPFDVVVPEERTIWAGEKFTIRKALLWGKESKFFELKKS